MSMMMCAIWLWRSSSGTFSSETVLPKDLLSDQEGKFAHTLYMDQITFETTTPQTSANEVMNFYKSCGRETKLEQSDILIIARVGLEIWGVVRLCPEHGYWVLRTMQVRDDLQGKGIGRKILNYFKEVAKERNIEKLYCMPYEHLEYFYSLIGFQKIDESQSPEFLAQRARDFHSRNPAKSVILMST